MTIWVDADACPKAIKDILYKIANRKKMLTIFVANHFLRVPPSRFIAMRQVEQGFDIADNHIVNHTKANDLVITADIPLADEVISLDAIVITTRGELLDKENIKERLVFRDLSDNLRSSDIQTKGPQAFHQRDLQKFANTIDKILHTREG